jgi:hypothetical protein
VVHVVPLPPYGPEQTSPLAAQRLAYKLRQCVQNGDCVGDKRNEFISQDNSFCMVRSDCAAGRNVPQKKECFRPIWNY